MWQDIGTTFLSVEVFCSCYLFFLFLLCFPDGQVHGQIHPEFNDEQHQERYEKWVPALRLQVLGILIHYLTGVYSKIHA